LPTTITKGGDLLFDTILLQICENFIKGVAEFFIEGDGPKTIAEMEVNLKEKADNFIVEIVEAYLEELDKSIVDDKASRRQECVWQVGNTQFGN
jgi:hypothetical protein